jgi:hypothetical protein
MTMTDPTTLEQQVADLRAEIAGLRAQLATEVRTRRLVVIDADGNERIYSELGGGSGDYAQWRVEIGTAAGAMDHASAVMQASAECGPAEAYVTLSVVDDAAVRMSAIVDDSEANKWTACHSAGGISIGSHRWKPTEHAHLLTAQYGRRLEVEANAIHAFADLERVGRAHFEYMPD